MVIPAFATLLQTATASPALATASAVSTIVIALAIVSMAVMCGLLFVRLNGILSELRRSAHQNFGPVSDRARSISDNLEYITQALRTDVEKLHASLRALSDRLQQASDRMEERIEEFNALMEVVQDEAEDIFLDTASTVRGVREGARTIAGASDRGDGRRPRRAVGSHPRGPTYEEEVEEVEGDERGEAERAERAARDASGEKTFPAREA